MMPKTRIIYIIGFMGSGKTTTGKKLATLLRWSFMDLDKIIEENSGMTIPEIFAQKGEEYFRKVEAQMLRTFKYETNTVLSTGGGTPCYDENMDFMVNTGLTVYLKLNPDQCMSRLWKSSHKRPLIQNMDQTRLIDFINDKLAYREKWYNMAEITINGFDLDINLIYSLVKANLK
jgi:shikimate kinase